MDRRRHRNLSPSPSPLPFRDLSNLHTPNPNPNSNPTSPLFFTASKKPLSTLTPTTSLRSRVAGGGAATTSAASRRLRALELDQSRSARRVESGRERALRAFAAAAASWLSLLLRDPSSCGCAALSAGDGERERCRSPKRRRGDRAWKGGGGETKKAMSPAMVAALRESLKDVCSLEDARERMEKYMGKEACEEVLLMMCQVCKNIDEGRLKMKAHCPLVTDLRLKEKATRVFMCYSPEWLRIGLHIVFGGDSLLQNGSGKGEKEVAFLKLILEKQFFAHSVIAKSFAYNKLVEGLHRPGYSEALGNVILKRILLLVASLDKAKMESALPVECGIDGLDGGSPLLFCHNSQIKSSRQIIHESLAEAMHGEGDLLMHLTILGCKLNYRQFVLSEYDFAVRNLFEDLQDGIILCRVAQLLLCDASIISRVIAPSDTRKKNMHNCSIAVQCFKQTGVSLSDKDGVMISAEDIVTGDKELILSLLWNVFVHLQLPLLVDRTSLVGEITKLKDFGVDHSTCDTKSHIGLLQEWIQIVCEKYGINAESSSRVDRRALCCLINCYLNIDISRFSLKENQSDCRKELFSYPQADSIIDATNCPSASNFSKVLGDFLQVLPASDILANNAFFDERSAIVLLAFLTSHLTNDKKLDQLRKLINKRLDYQSPEIKISARRRSRGKNDLICPSPRREEIPGSCTSQEWAATIIQTQTRQIIALNKYLERKKAIFLLQATMRAWLAVVMKSTCNSSSGACSTLQPSCGDYNRYFTFMLERHRFVQMRKSALVIQQAVRAWIRERKRHENSEPSENKELSDTAAPVTQQLGKGEIDCIAPPTPQQLYKGESDSIASTTPRPLCDGENDSIAPAAPQQPSNGESDSIASATQPLCKGESVSIASATPQQPCKGESASTASATPQLLCKGESVSIASAGAQQLCNSENDSISSAAPQQLCKGESDSIASATPQQMCDDESDSIASATPQQLSKGESASASIACATPQQLCKGESSSIASATPQQLCDDESDSIASATPQQLSKGESASIACATPQQLRKGESASIASATPQQLCDDESDYIASATPQQLCKGESASVASATPQQLCKGVADSIDLATAQQLCKGLSVSKASATPQQLCNGENDSIASATQQPCKGENDSIASATRQLCNGQNHSIASATQQLGKGETDSCRNVSCHAQFQNEQPVSSRAEFIHIEEVMAARKIQFAWKRFIHNKISKRISAATKIQSHWRGFSMRMCFTRQIQAIIGIQAATRCILCQRAFEQYCLAAIVIQRFVRGWLARKRLLGASSLQSNTSLCALHKTNRSKSHNSLELKIVIYSVLLIQRWWRKVLLHRSTVTSAISIQSFVRGWMARKQVDRMCCCINLIQRWWKRVLFLESRRRGVLVIQAHVRGWIARRAAIRDKKRITTIQSYVKAYLVRKSSKQEVTDLRCRLQKSAAHVDDDMRLINRLIAALSQLLYCRSISSIRQTCATLSIATEHSKKCCETLVTAGAVDILLKQIHWLNRGIPDQEVLKQVLSTLRNIARFPSLQPVLANTPQSVEIIFQELLRNKTDGFFIACDLLKKLCESKEGHAIARALQPYIRRLGNLVRDLEKKVELDKRNARVGVGKEMNLRRLGEVLTLYHLITNDC